MKILKAIVFGAVQDLTEFLPVSNIAHLIILQWFIVLPDQRIAFDVESGVLLEHKVEDALLAPQLISVMLIVMGLVLVAAEIVGRRKKGLDDISWGDAITVGIAQAFAIVP